MIVTTVCTRVPPCVERSAPSVVAWYWRVLVFNVFKKRRYLMSFRVKPFSCWYAVDFRSTQLQARSIFAWSVRGVFAIGSTPQFFRFVLLKSADICVLRGSSEPFVRCLRHQYQLKYQR